MTTTQAEYHADKFRSFSHMNSPAWLIKTIAGASAPAGINTVPNSVASTPGRGLTGGLGAADNDENRPL
jgi:hypothetical protein